jgi:hypothetical protein
MCRRSEPSLWLRVAMSSGYSSFNSFLRLPWLGGRTRPRVPPFTLSVSERYDVQKFSKTGNGK